MPKATVSTAAKSAVVVKATVIVPASVRALVTTAATANAKAEAAIRTSEQSIVKLSLAVREMKGEQKDISEALKPLFVKAYGEARKDYAGQQLSRIMRLAFPANSKAAAELERGIKGNMKINNLLPLARGSAKLSKEGALIQVKKDNRGGKNAKKPLDTFKFTIGNALTAAKTAKLDLDQIAVAIVEALTALEFAADDIASAFKDAAMED